MNDKVVLTTTEAASILMLLKSMTFGGMNEEPGIRFQATLDGLRERIEQNAPDMDKAQYELWEQLGKPGWVTQNIVS